MDNERVALLAFTTLYLAACAHAEDPAVHAEKMAHIQTKDVVFIGDPDWTYYENDKKVKARNNTIKRDMLNCPNVEDDELRRECWDNMEQAMKSGPTEPTNTVGYDPDSPVAIRHEERHIMNEIENRLNY